MFRSSSRINAAYLIFLNNLILKLFRQDYQAAKSETDFGRDTSE